MQTISKPHRHATQNQMEWNDVGMKEITWKELYGNDPQEALLQQLDAAYVLCS